MSDEGWTLGTLYKHLNERLDQMEARAIERDSMNKERFAAAKERVEMALVSSEKAITKAEAASDKRFDSVNEFRKTLSDIVATFIPRGEYMAQHNALSDRVQIIAENQTKSQAATEGRSKGVSMVAVIVSGAIAIMASLAAIGSFIMFVFFHGSK